MYRIRLQNCAFFACHGVLDAEEVLGQNLSACPLTFESYDLSRFLHSVELPLPRARNINLKLAPNPTSNKLRRDWLILDCRVGMLRHK